MLHRSKRRRGGVVVLAVVAALGLAACQPGWVNPIAGTGDGSGTPGAAVPEAQAAFQSPRSVAVSPVTNDVYVADTTACTISRIHDGQVTLVAGVPGSCGDTGDGDQATAAQIQPGTIQVAPDGTVYFVQDSVAIRHITADGVVQRIPYTRPTVPAWTSLNGIAGFSVDAVDAVRILESTDTTSSGSGTVYVTRVDADGSQSVIEHSTDSNVVQAVPIDATEFWNFEVHFVPGTSTAVFSARRFDVQSGDHGDFVALGFRSTLLAAAPDGTLYYYYSTGQIRRVDPDGTNHRIAGNGTGDPGTTRYWGMGTDQPISIPNQPTFPICGALTRNDGLVFTSGHVVYRMASPDQAGTTTTTIATT